MAEKLQTRRNRTASPGRWQRALERALFAGVEAKQLTGSGEWIVASASRPGIAYRTDGISCDCEAAMLGGDPVCLHRAAYWHAVGVLDLDPEPEPPAPVPPVFCFRCQGRDSACPVCAGAGLADFSAQAAALIADAGAGWKSTPAAPAAPAVPAATVARIGQAGHIAGYDVFLAGDTLHLIHAASGREWRHVVPNFGTALADLAQAPGLRLGWARFPDDAEAVYCYDAEDGGFGYALNLSDPALSEWGYAPFPSAEDRACDHCGGPLGEDAETDEVLETVCGACIDRARREAEAAVADAVAAAHAHDAWERAQLAA